MKKILALLLAAFLFGCCLAEGIPENVLERLNELGYHTGDSAADISNFQRANGLGVTGVLDPATQKAILSEKAMPEASYIRNYLKLGEYQRESGINESGRSVQRLQDQLSSLGYPVPTDGSFDEQTFCAVALFQAVNSIEMTGRADAATLERVYSLMAIPCTGCENLYTLETGASGQEVKQLQNELKELGYFDGVSTGVFGTATARAVREFQKANELEITGKWSIEQQSMVIAGKCKTKGETDEYKASLSLGVGTVDECVMELETQLKVLGYFTAVPDDAYDAVTQSAVRVFQEANGLIVTGTADPATRAMTMDEECVKHETYYQSAIVKSIQPGDNGYAVLLCSRRLIELGYPLSEKWVYDDELNQLLKIFRQSAGIYDAVGADMETRALMNSETALRYEEAKRLSDEYEAQKAESDKLDSILTAAKASYGKPYDAGKTGPDSYGTAGLITCCYTACGVEIPPTITLQLEAAKQSESFSADIGDVSEGRQLFWVQDESIFTGIYLGGGIVIAAMPEAGAVRLYDINSEFTGYEYIGSVYWS